jgi:hypothetical protein
LHLALLTLAKTPGMTLTALPLLLTDAGLRRRIVGRLDEPLVLQPAWAGVEALSEAERVAAVEPVLRRVRPLIIRPALRAVFGQVEPRFDLRQLFTERKIVLVNLGRGTLGPEAASLLGSILIARLWQVAQERARLPRERRHTVGAFLDELQAYVHGITDLGDALARSRSLGLAWCVAHQHLGQLPPLMRSAVLADARSRLVFQPGAEDARVFASGSKQLDADDFQSLPTTPNWSPMAPCSRGAA